MKKIVLMLSMLLTILVTSSIAFAGTLNNYEAEIVAAAKGQFESDGVTYQVGPSYINELIAYLSSDEVDLTEEEKELVLQSVKEYIETGIQEGYLVPIEEQPKNEDITSEETKPTEETPQLEDSDAEEAEKDNSDNQNTEDPGKVTGIPTEDSSVQNDGKQVTGDKNPEDLMEEILTNTPEESTTVDADDNQGVNNDIDNNLSSMDDSIIKTTGFNLNRTAIMAVGMGMLMIIGISVTIKYNYFAHNDE